MLLTEYKNSIGREDLLVFVLWMTGLPCSGKTTIAKKLREYVDNLAVLDGDELREWLSPKDFSKEGRIQHNNRVAHLAKLLITHRVPVCVSLISPYKENRQNACTIVGRQQFIEVYVKCSISVCQQRDVKEMYKRAKRNEIKHFTGVSDVYEIPDNPELVIDSENLSSSESVKAILSFIKENGYYK